MQKLEQAYRCCQGELMRMNKNVQQLQQMKSSLEATSFQTSADGGGRSNDNSQNSTQNSNTQPSPNNSGKSNFKGKGRGKGTRKSSYDPPGKPAGGSKLCFWCRNFTTFEQANHPLKDCPHGQRLKLNVEARSAFSRI